MPAPHLHPVTIYYEDTDFSGFVYHANYLKYFERAREHLLGVDRIASLYREQGTSFVVYRLEVHYKAPAVHADLLEVRSTMQQESPYRVLVKQSAWRRAPEALLVDATVQLACIDREGQLCTIPPGLIPPT